MRKIHFLFFITVIAIFSLAQAIDMENKEIVAVESSLRYPVKIKGVMEPPMNLRERMAYHKIHCVSIAVIDQGKIAWTKGYGTRTAEANEPVDENTLFQASSITKMVTAMGVLLLVQEGKLDLDTDVGIYLKRWKVPKRPPYENDPLTIRQLLSHTGGISISGLAGYVEGETLPNVLEFLNCTKPISKDCVVEVIAKPGDKFQYSGGGIAILEVLVEDVTGMPFKDYIQKVIFNPLGMKRSYLEHQLPKHTRNFIVGDDANGKPISGKYHSHPSLSASGLWTTPTDLAKLGLNIQQSSHGKGLLSPKMASLMTTRIPGNFEAPVALGTFIQEDGKVFGHGGRNPGSRCNARFLVDGGKGVVIMTNSDNGSLLEDELRLSIYDVYHWPGISVEKTLAKIDSKTLHSYAGMFWEVVDEGTAKERKIESSMISVEEDHLIIQWRDYRDYDFREWDLAPPIRIYPESKTEFFGRHGSSLTFDDNQSFKLFGKTQFKNRM
jgi:CubicO group peptidase (beta-lactamase class C family)